MRAQSLIAAALLGLVADRSPAGDWPGWRGPERNGVAERSPPLVARLSGTGWAWRSEGLPSGEEGGRGSLAVAGGRVYGLTRAAGAEAPDEVFCLEAGSGRVAWRVRLGGGARTEPSSATPCVYRGRIYVAGSGDRLYCLDAASGAEVWSAPLERKEKGALASSAAAAAGIAVLQADALVAFDAETGRKLWTQDRVGGYQSSPAVWQSRAGQTYFICNTRLETACVEALTGKVAWTVPGGELSTPAVAGEYGGDFLAVLSGGRRNGLSAYRLEEDGPRKLWSYPVHDRGASPLISNGHVYAIAGGSNGHGAKALCIHLDSGTLAWEEAIDFAEVSSPALADGKILAVCGTFLRVIAAQPEEYSVLSVADCRVTLCTSPAVADGRLFLRQANAVVCYDLRAGGE